MELLIKNGFVFDPLNEINGEKMDISIRDGRIVESVNDNTAQVIDANGLTVMPGGFDVHSHIAGKEVNAGRIMRPEDHVKDVECKTALTRAGVGYSVPSVYTTGYRYARMGYTTVMNPSMAAIGAKHTHEELNDIPLLDKATFPLLGDWWVALEHIRDGDLEGFARHVAWMINAVRGYAIKIVNPGGLESWGFGRNVRSLDDQVPNFGITPRDIIRSFAKINTMLNLPHTIHLHTNNLGVPGNYVSTIETMKTLEDLATDGKPIAHITHLQFSSLAGHDWSSFRSGAEEIANYVNNHSHMTFDMGQVTFTDTTTMTADGPFEFNLHLLSGHKWSSTDIETETCGGVVPFQYKANNFVNAIQWSIGLELALLIKDPWKMFMNTDHPNGGPFTEYPKVISWLASKKARLEVLNGCHKRAQKKSLLPSIDREMSLYEIAIATRAGAAKALGFTNKGHLGVGAEADVTVYNLNPETTDVAKQPEILQKVFSSAAYTIKGGTIVVKNGEIVKVVDGKTMWANVKTKEQAEVEEGMKRKFKEYYSIEYDNYPVSDHYLKVSESIPIKADV